MNDSLNKQSPDTLSKIREHLANETTFLAWIRTSLGLMVFGFVVVKFSLFLKQLSIVFTSAYLPQAVTQPKLPQPGFSSYLGISLLALGAVIAAFSYLKFNVIAKQIESNTYQRNNWLDALLAFSVIAVAIFLIVYLVNSI